MKLMIAAVLAVCSVPAATQAQADAPATPSKKAPNPNRKICRHEADTGSHFTTSVCHTAQEWAQIDEANQRALENRPNTGGVQR